MDKTVTTVGIKGIYWGGMMAELVTVLFDLRYMFICSVILIAADLWWGYSECKMRRAEAQALGNKTLEEKFRWRFSRAARRTANKCVDYLTYLAIGAFVGLAITEPMGICSHVWSAAMGLGIGCASEIASIVGHVAYVKMHVEVGMVDAWKAVIRFFGRLIKQSSHGIGEAVEQIGHDHGQHHHDDNVNDNDNILNEMGYGKE